MRLLPRRLALPLFLLCALLLAGCAGFGGDEDAPIAELLATARASLRQTASLRFTIEPIGEPPALDLSIEGIALALHLVRADAQVVQPAALWLDGRLSAGPITLDLAVFMLERAQYYRLPAFGWQQAILAEDFTPGQLLADGGTLDQALLSLARPQSLGLEYLADGQRAHHLYGAAAGATLSPLLFDLAVLPPRTNVDVWLERERLLPVRLELRDPATASGWRFAFYDFDRAPHFVDEELPAAYAYDAGQFRASARAPAHVSAVATVLGAVIALLLLSFAAIALALRRQQPAPATTEAQYPPARVARRVLAAILIPLFIGSLDLTVVSAFLPELFVDLNLPLQTASDDALWVVSGYLLAYMVSLTYIGRASDLLGRRPLYLASLALFFVGSLWVAQANALPYEALSLLFTRLGLRLPPGEIGLHSILVGRVILAFGAGAIVPCSLALASDLFPPGRRARAFGLIAAVDTLGWVLGHLYGGALIAFFASPAGQALEEFAHRLGAAWFELNWQTLFWVNLPLTVLALVVVRRGMRGLADARAAGRFDFIGAALLAAAIIALIIGLGANIDPSADLEAAALPPYALPLLLLSAACLAAAILFSRRRREPIFAWRDFQRPPLAAASAANLLIGFAIMINLISVPTLVNVTLESTRYLAQGALRVGLLLSGLTVPMALAAYPGGRLTERYGAARVTSGGLAIAALGFTLIWRSWQPALADGWIALQLAIVGVGLGLTLAPISSASLSAARAGRRGAIAALVILLRLLGMAISAAALANFALNRINARAVQALGARPGSGGLRRRLRRHRHRRARGAGPHRRHGLRAGPGDFRARPAAVKIRANPPRIRRWPRRSPPANLPG